MDTCGYFQNLFCCSDRSVLRFLGVPSDLWTYPTNIEKVVFVQHADLLAGLLAGLLAFLLDGWLADLLAGLLACLLACWRFCWMAG